MQLIKGSAAFFVVALVLFTATPSQAAVAPLSLQKSIDAARRDFQTRIGGSREIYTLVFIDASPLLAAHSHRLASDCALDPASVTLFFANNPVQNTDPMGLQVLQAANAAAWMALNTVQVGIEPKQYFMEFNGKWLVVKDAETKNPVKTVGAVSGNPKHGWSETGGPIPPAIYRIEKKGPNAPALFDPTWTGVPSPTPEQVAYSQARWGVGRALLRKVRGNFHGRTGFYFHGGLGHPDGPWYTVGCVKVADSDWSDIINEYVKKNKTNRIPVEVKYPAGGIYKETVP